MKKLQLGLVVLITALIGCASNPKLSAPIETSNAIVIVPIGETLLDDVPPDAAKAQGLLGNLLSSGLTSGITKGVYGDENKLNRQIIDEIYKEDFQNESAENALKENLTDKGFKLISILTKRRKDVKFADWYNKEVGEDLAVQENLKNSYVVELNVVRMGVFTAILNTRAVVYVAMRVIEPKEKKVIAKNFAYSFTKLDIGTPNSGDDYKKAVKNALKDAIVKSTNQLVEKVGM